MDIAVVFRRAFADPEDGCHRFLELRHFTGSAVCLRILRSPCRALKVIIARWYSQ